MKNGTNAVFRAISDPTRRKIIDLLSESQQSVKQLTANFNMSQPAVSQHLHELRVSRLVRSERVGVEQLYTLVAEPLAEVFHWVSAYRTLFDPAGHAWTFSPAQGKAVRKRTKKVENHHGD